MSKDKNIKYKRKILIEKVCSTGMWLHASTNEPLEDLFENDEVLRKTLFQSLGINLKFLDEN